MTKQKKSKNHGIKGILIVKLNWLDAITLTGIAFALASVLHSHFQRFENAIAFMFVAMLVDSMEGVFAKLLKMERMSGRILDGFVDFLVYIIAPAVYLYYFGFERLGMVWILLLFGIAGIIRLSVYDLAGDIKDKKDSVAYLGLPIIWTHFITAGFYFLALFIKSDTLVYFAGFVMLLNAFLILLNKPFAQFETKPYTFAVIISLIVIFFWMGFGKGQPLF
ncbi:MAG: CDP-alcohol phosphatidyltransferase family protein [Spirochaetia bacterium]|nr:CDP-alcohol phosphatidyltransferase family protein [Spirochaetia bacterium]